MPGWGWQYDPATVLTQMRELGLRAIEFGPEDFLPEAPEAKAAVLGRHGLAAVGQFVPVVLHDPDHDPLREVHLAMDGLVAAHTPPRSCSRQRPDPRGTTPARCSTPRAGPPSSAISTGSTWPPPRVASRRPCTPHVGTMVESGEETERVLRGSGIGQCLDTGHLLIGGGDPVAVAQQSPDRLAHVHLKDVAADVAAALRHEGLSYTDGVRAGMYRPLGAGDVDVAAIVTSLENAGYPGWYVLEQDTILDA